MNLKSISVVIGLVVAIVGYGWAMGNQFQTQPLPTGGSEPDSLPAVSAAPSRIATESDSAITADKPHNANAKDNTTEPSSSPVEATTVIKPKRQVRNSQIIIDNQKFTNHPYQAMTTNDPLGNQDWEQTIGLDSARSIGNGDYTPTVAVIDSGFALDHEDLQGLWATNLAESGPTGSEAPSRLNCTDQGLPLDRSCNNIDDNFNGIVDDETGVTNVEHDSTLNCTDQGLALDKSCNLIDDDGNGLVDDYIGYDFINFERSVAAGQTDPADQSAAHGTLVSGVVGAINNNSTGMAGVADQVKILPLQALDDSGNGYTISVADAVIYATQRQVDVINLSLGGAVTDSYLRQAIDYATYHGVLVIAASGNDGCDCISYPAAQSSVVAVGALDSEQQPASFSNWGEELDIMAPGTSLVTTNWSTANQTQAYASASGTSLATPVVSGLAARLISQQPDLSPIQAKALLSESSNRLSLTADQPRSDQLGFGMVDAQSASQRATVGLDIAQITSYSSIRHGQAYQSLWSRQEVDIPNTIYNCNQTEVATTEIYQLSKGSDLMFTVSQAERDRALDQGYSSQLAFYGCMLMPHDQSEILRTINTYEEFYNRQDRG